MKLILESWQNFISEADAAYEQVASEVRLEIKVDKNLGGNIEETLNEIRRIPGVTRVSTEPDTSHSDDNFHYAVQNCKYVLLKGESHDTYINNVLIPHLNKIKGLTRWKFKRSVKKK
jgi:hypothetical protein